jgi:flagellar FliL protein
MPDRTLDTRNGRSEQAAPETSPAAPEDRPAPSSKAWLPLILTVILMPALAFAMTRFVLVPEMKKALSPAADAATTESAGTNAEASPGPSEGKSKVTVELTKILVNVAGTMGTRYLMTSVTLVGTDESLRNKIEQNKAQMLDLATGTL